MEPQQIIKDVRFVKSDIGPEYALKLAWDNLDERYETGHSPSQQLMSSLLKGPQITLTDTSSMFRISMHCQSALAIRQADPTTLRSLDEQSILDTLVNRLDAQLRVQWLQHRQIIKTPTFQLFADWIKKWANISRMDKDINPHQASSNYAEATHNSKPYNTSYGTPHLPKKPFQQRTSPGEREYRDALRQRRNSNPNPSTPTRERSPSPSRSMSPRTRPPSPTKTSDNIPTQRTPQTNNRYPNPSNTPRYPQQPRNIEMKCGYCYFHNKPHNHATPNCGFLKNAEVSDRWHVAYKSRLCQKCLSPNHYHKECKETTPRCVMCNWPHHPILGCRPTPVISAYPPEEAENFDQKNAQ